MIRKLLDYLELNGNCCSKLDSCMVSGREGPCVEEMGGDDCFDGAAEERVRRIVTVHRSSLVVVCSSLIMETQ